MKDMFIALGIPMKNPARNRHMANAGILDVTAGSIMERQKKAVREKLAVTARPY